MSRARLLRAGHLNQAAIAGQLGVSRVAVILWKQALAESGLRGLAARPVPGRPAQMRSEDWQRLLRILKRGARRAGFETERWTLPRIGSVVQREFQVSYSTAWLSRRLAQLGWRVQLPVARALEQDDELVAAWLQHDWPRIKKKLADNAR
jgi:transposase